MLSLLFPAGVVVPCPQLLTDSCIRTRTITYPSLGFCTMSYSNTAYFKIDHALPSGALVPCRRGRRSVLLVGRRVVAGRTCL